MCPGRAQVVLLKFKLKLLLCYLRERSPHNAMDGSDGDSEPLQLPYSEL